MPRGGGDVYSVESATNYQRHVTGAAGVVIVSGTGSVILGRASGKKAVQVGAWALYWAMRAAPNGSREKEISAGYS